MYLVCTLLIHTLKVRLIPLNVPFTFRFRISAGKSIGNTIVSFRCNICVNGMGQSSSHTLDGADCHISSGEGMRNMALFESRHCSLRLLLPRCSNLDTTPLKVKALKGLVSLERVSKKGGTCCKFCAPEKGCVSQKSSSSTQPASPMLGEGLKGAPKGDGQNSVDMNKRQTCRKIVRNCRDMSVTPLRESSWLCARAANLGSHAVMRSAESPRGSSEAS